MNKTSKYHVTAIGNALVDFLCTVDDAFIDRMDLQKGGFGLINLERAKALYKNMGPAKEISGGSAANTISALAELGCQTGFIGSIADDQVGTIFAHDMQSIGVDFKPIIHKEISDNETGRCYILVSPDAQRTMSTYLGVAGIVPEAKLDKPLIKNSQILYVEGYMWVIDETKQAILKAVDYAHKCDNKTAVTLSDVFCVNSFRDEFLDIIQHKFDIIFANEAEAMALFQVDNLQAAVEKAQKTGKIFAITCGEHGSIIVENDIIIKNKAVKPVQLIDTTGAGDAFAAGFLYGLVYNKPYNEAADIGSLIASEIISHVGARSEQNLQDLLKKHQKSS
ncbi:MAG: sugar/nucleoside kinase (ribokinase family) [Alphaproteobacteria bacterium]|jgi:sugar/nucleoside kinase (ribokinase family)